MSHHSRKHRIINPTLAAIAVGTALGAMGCGAHATLPQGASTIPEAAQAAFARCGVDADSVDAVWKEYREQRPFHAQQIAASEPLEGGCRVLILSEPPADITVAKLAELNPALSALFAQRHRIGVDGWTEDLVGVVPPMPADDLSELTSDLHIAVFGSAYRARLAPIAAPSTWTGTLDIEVRPAEIYGWVFGEEASFSSVEGGAHLRAADLLEPQQTGVYVSTTSGLVLWSLPKAGSFEEQKANVRMFGLESDLVLGAVSDEDAVLVIGRERIAPEEVLPPLRFETVKMLATTSTEQLRQSYERNQLLAGSLRSGKDWAPILLSPELIDSELGSVLNITDQMLKRWSSNGTVKYEQFDYRREPTEWAFARPISQELGASSLTFNWNTSASGGLVKVSDDRSLYWMNRTGALHVSYLPGDTADARTAIYEERARDFFARQSDPYLVRAVQYTALFQAFRQLGVSSLDERADIESMMDSDPSTAILESSGTETFKRLSTATDHEVEEACRRFVEQDFATVPAGALLEHLVESAPRERRAELRRRVQNASANDALAVMTAVKREAIVDIAGEATALRSRLAATHDVEAPRHLAIALTHRSMIHFASSNPESWRAGTATLSSAKARATAAEIAAAAAFLDKYGFDLKDDEQWRRTAEVLSNVDAVESQYRAASSSRVTTSRIRTPTVVRSRNGALLVHGGHNVGSEVPSLVRAIEPSDLPHVRLDKEGLSYRPVAPPPRPRPVALGGVAKRPPPLEIAAAGHRAPPPAAPGGGWARLPQEPAIALGGNSITVRLFDNASGAASGQSVLRSRFKVGINDSTLCAGSTADIAEAAVRKLARESRTSRVAQTRVDIQLLDENLSEDEAQGIAQNIHARIARQRLGTDDGYVFHRSAGPIALDRFDLGKAVVSAPVRTEKGFTISVSAPQKHGTAHTLFLRFFERGEPAADAVAKAQEVVVDGARGTGAVRSAEDLARELKIQFGKAGSASMLELAIDAQDGRVENDPTLPLPRYRYGGTPGHSF